MKPALESGLFSCEYDARFRRLPFPPCKSYILPIRGTAFLWHKGQLMGSSGTGRFSDYPGSEGGRPSGGGKGGDGKGGGGGGASDKCEASISGMSLEEVATSEYFKNHNAVPAPKTKVRVRMKAVGGRIAIETLSRGEVVGLVPTAYNYLRACMTKGWEYAGTVTDSSSGKLPKVKVDLVATK